MAAAATNGNAAAVIRQPYKFDPESRQWRDFFVATQKVYFAKYIFDVNLYFRKYIFNLDLYFKKTTIFAT